MLHLVDQSLDAVDLGTNQRRETLAPRIGLAREQLRRALDTGKRVLDLVREHRRRRASRTPDRPADQLGIASRRHERADAVAAAALWDHLHLAVARLAPAARLFRAQPHKRPSRPPPPPP